MRDIGKNIRDLRIQAGLNQDQLAERLYVTRQTISNYENGRTRPDVDQILRIAEIFDTDANTVLYGPPLPTGRRSTYIRAALGGGLTLALGAVWFLLVPIAKNWQRTSYDIRPAMALALLLKPLLLLLLGWTLVQILSLFITIKPPQTRWSLWLRRGLLAVVLCGLLLPTAAYFLLMNTPLFQALPRFLRSFLQWSVAMGVSAKVSYLSPLFGAALRLLDFPTPHTSAEKSSPPTGI